jgi:tRNA(Arg) A34 adenosine deaminase TadA
MPRPRAEKTGGEARLHPFHEAFMRHALEAARTALHLGEVPIGAIVVLDGQIVAQGFNQPIHRLDPTAHAEVIAQARGGAHARHTACPAPSST